MSKKRVLNEMMGAVVSAGTEAVTEAAEIPLSDVAAPQAKFMKQLQSKLRWKAETAWEGIHGTIIQFKMAGGSGYGGQRFDKGDLKTMMSGPTFRWFQIMDKDSAWVGM